MRRTAVRLTTALTGALLLAGCGDSDSGSGDGKPELSVSGAYMPQPVTADMAAGFLTIANKGGTKDELTSVSSDAAGTVTMHETQGGTMREVTEFAVPAHGRLVFESGANHLMFEKLKRKPTEGQSVSVTLRFAESGPVKVTLPVKSATYRPATGH
ncbi:copper chaperone PCu(A)C [Streptomyces sp. TRM68367]|uniref:copper chaperone PCu(A)C n=1 Tax=Streptomyces sp. TRM68367 TaxID=2758415 RepID=UPI00165C93C4|nr:copper chaperone PCu(A)C [Streptomyces sp. TRM68367]MBC9728436.1 copper chaperone PCu(A)C [Streptomyces sp. TRM68367]